MCVCSCAHKQSLIIWRLLFQCFCFFFCSTVTTCWTDVQVHPTQINDHGWKQSSSSSSGCKLICLIKLVPIQMGIERESEQNQSRFFLLFLHVVLFRQACQADSPKAAAAAPPSIANLESRRQIVSFTVVVDGLFPLDARLCRRRRQQQQQQQLVVSASNKADHHHPLSMLIRCAMRL